MLFCHLNISEKIDFTRDTGDTAYSKHFDQLPKSFIAHSRDNGVF